MPEPFELKEQRVLLLADVEHKRAIRSLRVRASTQARPREAASRATTRRHPPTDHGHVAVRTKRMRPRQGRLLDDNAPHATQQFWSPRPETPVMVALDTALHAVGPPTFTPEQLRHEQDRSLETPRRPNVLLLPFFASIDVLYGRRLSIEKFLVLEHLAQVPYRSWERVAQRRIARSGGRSVLARRIQQRVAEARAQHDNEQWHMLVMEHLVARSGRRLTRLRHRLLPGCWPCPGNSPHG